MRVFFVFGVFCFLLSSGLGAQEAEQAYALFKRIPVKAHFLTSDQLQQFYLVDERNDLVKYNPAGTEVFRYNNNKLGLLESVDVSNPFHLLLYYPEFNTLVTLDRTLSETGSYNINDLGVLQTNAVGLAYDNNIWIYDEFDYRLRKYDQQGQVLVESPNLSVLLSQPIHPITILEKDNRVYLHDPETSILVFDIFGQFIQALPLPPVPRFQIRDKHLIAWENGQLFAWQLEGGIKHPIVLPVAVTKEELFRLEQNCFFVLGEGEVRIYRRG